MDSPGTALGVTGVASFKNADIPIVFVDGTNEADGSPVTSFGWTPAEPPDFPNGTYPLHPINYNTNTTATDDACRPLAHDVPDLSQHLVLIRIPKSCSVVDQMRNIALKGVKFIMVYANSAGTYKLIYSREFGQRVGMTTQRRMGSPFS